ncbi:MAG: hypothetical protein WA064_04645 [Candidatus Moraniibacteriota bacterium]
MESRYREADSDYGKAEMSLNGLEYSIYYTAQTEYEEEKCQCLSCGIDMSYFPVTVEITEMYNAETMVIVNVSDDDMKNLKKALQEREEHVHKFCEICFNVSLI